MNVPVYKHVVHRRDSGANTSNQFCTTLERNITYVLVANLGHAGSYYIIFCNMLTPLLNGLQLTNNM